MRYTIPAMAALLLGTAFAPAQHDPYAAVDRQTKAVDEANNLQRQLQKNILGTSSDANAQIASLKKQGQSLADQTAIVNNVISFRKKDELAQWVDEAKKKWNAESGPRIRIFNPYEMSSYSRYYDEKGNLMVSEVRNSYEYLQQQRQDWAKARKRAEQSVDELEREYNKAARQYGTLQTAQSELAVSLLAARKRLDDFTGKAPAPGDPELRPIPRPIAARPDPGSLGGYRGEVGKTFYFEVVGAAGGIVWGDGIYTDDSALATAAVHAGVLQAGQRGTVKVTILSGRGSYSGSTQNGVTTQDWDSWGGSYRVERAGN